MLTLCVPYIFALTYVIDPPVLCPCIFLLPQILPYPFNPFSTLHSTPITSLLSLDCDTNVDLAQCPGTHKQHHDTQEDCHQCAETGSQWVVVCHL